MKNELSLVEILNKIMLHPGPKIHNYHGLHEIFDFSNKQLPRIHEFGTGNYEFSIELDGEEIEIPVYVTISSVTADDYKFVPLLKKAETIFSVEYGISEEMVSDQFKKSALDIFSFIMFVITKIVQDFVQNEQPDIVVFFADSKDGTLKGEMQKLTAYRYIISKNTPAGYVYTKIVRDAEGKEGCLIYKRDRFHGKNRLK